MKLNSSNYLVVGLFHLLTWCLTVKGNCQILQSNLCSGLQYNQTFFPNYFNHKDQSISQTEMDVYRPMIVNNCSPVIRQFLCSLYMPKCISPTSQTKPIPPCRPLCIRARDDCKKFLSNSNFGLTWSDSFKCENFPPVNALVCINENFTIVQSVSSRPPSVNTSTSPSTRACGILQNQKSEYTFLNIPGCAKPCHDFYFNSNQIQLASSVVGIVAILAFCCTLLIFITFLIDRQGYEYPERSVIFLVFCYCVLSLTYIVGFMAQRNIACNPSTQSVNSTVHQGSGKEGCTVLFLINYFFTIASSVWWVVFSLGWYLAAGKKWVEEGINAVSHYFHLAAWLIPAILTIVVLALGKIEGDVLSGICFVNTRSNYLYGFVIAPLSIFLLIGLGFSIATLISFYRIRREMLTDHRQGDGTAEFEKLLKKIGIFAFLYVVPGIIVISCYLYEASNQNSWTAYWQQQNCRRYSMSCSSTSIPANAPNLAIFIVKYIALFSFGIASSYWIGLQRAVTAWKLCYRRLTVNRGEGDQDSVTASQARKIVSSPNCTVDE
uniref:Frizzled A n=2 Tax=Trichoplax adhaerens TaxID=10228 RepID=A0A0B5CS95_TRIAD|nr:frizzled A [Trichoplax adhaerens]